MFRNYFKLACRSLLRDRQFSILNFAGLSVALTCGLLIYLWISHEWNIDKFHVNKNRLYQVMAHIKLPDGIQTQENTPSSLGRTLAEEMPEVEKAVSLQQGYGQGVLSAGEKVLGASVGSITAMLSKQFLQLVIISFLIAAPLAWWTMNQWLQNFAYRIEIRWWMFGLAGFAAIMIAFISVSFQAVKAAIVSPVKSLRRE